MLKVDYRYCDQLSTTTHLPWGIFSRPRIGTVGGKSPSCTDTCCTCCVPALTLIQDARNCEAIKRYSISTCGVSIHLSVWSYPLRSPTSPSLFPRSLVQPSIARLVHKVQRSYISHVSVLFYPPFFTTNIPKFSPILHVVPVQLATSSKNVPQRQSSSTLGSQSTAPAASFQQSSYCAWLV